MVEEVPLSVVRRMNPMAGLSNLTPNKIDKHFFIDNRRRLAEKMSPNSVAILGGNYPLYTNGDGVLPYVPNHDLWYFTGVEQDESLLLLVKHRDKQKVDGDSFEEHLFVLPCNPAVEIWDGARLSLEGAEEISGINHIHSTLEWEGLFKEKIIGRDILYLNLPEHPRAPFYRNRNHDLYQHCLKHFPLYRYERLAPLIHPLRMIKGEAEISEIQNATEISRQALEKILPLLKGGYHEKDIEAEMTAVYTRYGGPAFSPIVASGKNSCTLHYISNRGKLTSGEVILIDSGARAGLSGRYPADITRVFPISGSGVGNRRKQGGGGEFTSRQRQVYDAVLRVLKRTSALVKPGVSFLKYRQQSLEFMKRELFKLGLLKKEDRGDPTAYRRYFMHGVSHWLGLDVHDVGGYDGNFKKGMVLTCEPGIYIPEEGLGVRLENNLWIKSSRETINLSASVPLEVEEVYQWLADHS